MHDLQTVFLRLLAVVFLTVAESLTKVDMYNIHLRCKVTNIHV